MTTTPLRVGTRASLLARTQSGHVADALRAALGREVVLVDVTTDGDVSTAPLASFGGVGVFVSALRDALLRGDVDVAVHSLKDLPTGACEGITLAAVPLREDPRDVVIARDGLTLGELPAGSRVGTGSPRRVAQLHALGLGFDVVGIRGNVDTRIRKVAEGEYDAVVLARAGVSRLGRLDEVTEVLDPLQMLPAPGQGALAVECRTADTVLVDELREALEDPRTRAAVTAERVVLAGLGGRLLGTRRRDGRGGRGRRRRRAVDPGGGALARRRRRRTPVFDRFPRRCDRRGESAGRGDVDRRSGNAHRGACLVTDKRKAGSAGATTGKAGTKTGSTGSRRGSLNNSKRATVSKTVTKNAATGTTPRVKAKPAAEVVNEPRPSAPIGFVSFVGSGPGDPELLTVRAVDLLRQAEIVVTEAPEHADLVANLAPGAEVVDGGFGTDGQPLTHAGRAKVVVKQAKSGKRVVRLMAGDPFVYASGPEEAQACVKAGVGFEIVPGVSSVTAVPAYAGVPLTDKKHREVAVVNCSQAKVDWTAYADDRTLVLLSAVSSIDTVASALIAAGRSETTPVAMTRVGTTTEQETVVSTLGRIAADAHAARMTPPAVTVVGDVVDLRATLSWFETKPLFGWRVLVPRTKEQAGSLSARLRGFGAVPEEVPTISVEPPRNPQQMDKAIRGLVEGRYEWIAFTSVNAVRAVREKFDEYGLDARAFSGLKIAAVGEKTAAAIEAWGLRADLVPSGEQSARGLLEDWPPYDDVLDPINRVFLPRADIATENLVAGLVDLGWEVDDVTAYRTVRATPPPAPTREAIKSGKFDAVVFTSSSTVRNLVGIAGKPHASTVIAVIGPATAKTAEEHGLRVDVLAPSPSVEDLVDALADFGAARRASLLEAGQPVTKPSERRPAARRKAT